MEDLLQTCGAHVHVFLVSTPVGPLKKKKKENLFSCIVG